jgi:hypothetical protein
MTTQLTNEQAAKILALMQQGRHSTEGFEALRMAEAALRAQDWQPIETAPKDGTAFFACLEASDIPHAMRFNEEGQLVLTWDGWVVDAHDWPTHWMAIPHPQGEEHGQG